MIISFKKTLRKNLRLVLFILLIFIIASASIYSNQVKKIKNQKSNELINNVYFKKTLNYLFNNLKPKYKKTRPIAPISIAATKESSRAPVNPKAGISEIRTVQVI